MRAHSELTPWLAAVLVLMIAIVGLNFFFGSGPIPVNSPEVIIQMTVEIQKADPGDFIIMRDGNHRIVINEPSPDGKYLQTRAFNSPTAFADAILYYAQYAEEVIKQDDPRWPELAKRALGVHR